MRLKRVVTVVVLVLTLAGLTLYASSGASFGGSVLGVVLSDGGGGYGGGG